MFGQIKEVIKNNRGFTLVEISIVLVIIGLIVSGVLIGQELVKNAEVRSLITQVEGYNTAVYTFKDKFGTLPGDFSNGTTMLGATSDGDGNGLVHDAAGVPAAVATTIAGEVSGFWDHLDKAGMTGAAYSGDVDFSNLSGANQNFPTMKGNNAAGIVVYSDASYTNYFHLGIVGNSANANILTGPALTPASAYNFDQKIDDGIADNGNVQARGATTLEGAATDSASGQNGCVITGSLNSYNAAQSNSLACQLRLRVQ